MGFASAKSFASWRTCGGTSGGAKMAMPYLTANYAVRTNRKNQAFRKEAFYWCAPLAAPRVDFKRHRGDNRGFPPHHADVAELADALDSGSSWGNSVKVQVLSSAPIKSIS